MPLEDIAARIRRARKALGWTQKGLAKEAGVSEQTIVNIEMGHRRPNWGTLEKIAKVLNI